MARRPTLGKSPLEGITPLDLVIPPKAGGVTEPSPDPSADDKASINPNPPKGAKSDFLKVTVSLSPEIYALLSEESSRRRLAREKDSAISAIIREAVVEKLTQG